MQLDVQFAGRLIADGKAHLCFLTTSKLYHVSLSNVYTLKAEDYKTWSESDRPPLNKSFSK